MPHVHQVPVCKHQHSRHSLATLAFQLPRDHATWTTPPDSPAREIQNDGPRTTARQYQCPYIEVNNNIMYTFKCLPGRSQACNPRPPQLPCTESQSADTALPASQDNETPTTYSAVQNTMYKSKCLPGRSQARKPRPP